MGTGGDAKIYYSNTDLILDPNIVGTGKVLIGATGDDDLIAGNIGVGTSTPSSILQLYGTGTSTITIGGGGSPACIKARDTDDLGWSYGTLLNGAITWGTVSCE